MSPSPSPLSKAIKYQTAGKFDKAKIAYERILKKEPNNPAALVNLGVVYHKLNRSEQALKLVDRGITFMPNQPIFLFNKGLILQKLQRHEEAINCFAVVLRSNPRDGQAYFEVGFCLLQLKRYDEAVPYYHKAAELAPTVEVLDGIGCILRHQKHHERAAEAFRQALTLNDNIPHIHYNYAQAVEDPAIAIRHYERAIALAPSNMQGYAPMVRCYQDICDWSHYDEHQKRLLAITHAELQAGQKTSVACFNTFALKWPQPIKYAVNRSWSLAAEKEAAKYKDAIHFDFSRPDNKRIRIGYLSGDFRNHVLARLIRNLFEAHDTSQFEIFAYSYGKDDGSEYRDEIKKTVEHFIDIHSRTTLESAKKIHEDQIDILIDLTGHTEDNNIAITAMKSAPIQINYLASPDTFSADFVDYIFADAITVPTENECHFSEKVVRLPHCYFLTDTQAIIDDAPLSRSDLSLPDDQFVFCCFNSSYKLEPEIFSIWMNILKKVPDSVLWLLSQHPAQDRNLKKAAKAHGVNPDRLVFSEKVKAPQYLARQKLADLFLDTYYVNAITTATDALWMNVPVLATLGDSYVNRASSSILNAIGLPELVMSSLAEYEEKAIELANNPQLLITIREKLIKNKTTFPLFNTLQFTQHIERAYTMIWDRYKANKLPCSFDVPEISSC